MIQLSFDPSAFPRTTTRSEWKDIWRWKRETEKKIAATMKSQMDNFRIYGSTWAPFMQEEFIQRVINPPIMMHPKQQVGYYGPNGWEPLK